MKRRNQKGQSLLEFALVLPVLLIIISGIIDMGHAMLVWSNLSNAAREGSRYGAAHPGDTQGIVNAVRSKIISVPPGDVAVRISYDDGVFGQTVDLSAGVPGQFRVVVTPNYTYRPFTPFINRIMPASNISFVSARTVVGSGGIAQASQPDQPTVPPAMDGSPIPTSTPNPGGDIEFTATNLNVCVYDTFNLSSYVSVEPSGMAYTFHYETAPSPDSSWHLSAFNAGQPVMAVPGDLNGGNEGLGYYRVSAFIPGTGESASILVHISDCGQESPTPTVEPTQSVDQCSNITASELTAHNDELRVTLTNNNHGGHEGDHEHGDEHGDVKLSRIVLTWPHSDDHPDMKVKEFKLDDHKIWEGDDHDSPTDAELSGDDEHHKIENDHHKTWKAKFEHGPEHLDHVFNMSDFQVTFYFDDGNCAVSSTGSSQAGPTHTPEPTETATPTPLPTTVPQCSDLAANDLTVASYNTTYVKTTITNNSDEDAKLERIVFTWPTSDDYPNMKVDWFSLGGHTLWYGDGHDGHDDVDVRHKSHRTIGDHHHKVWRADFDHSPINLANFFNMSDFVVTFYFEGGCSVTTNGSGGGGENTPVPTSTPQPGTTPTPVVPTPNAGGEICYVSTNPDTQHGPAQLYTTLTVTDLGDRYRVRLALDPNFVDNTYGTNSVGYYTKKGQPKQHSFSDLYKSDRAEFLFYDSQNNNVLDLFLDYVEADGTSYGVSGGDGSVVTGNPSWVTGYDTAMAYNFRVQPGMTADSPAIGDPNWDFTVWYVVEVSKAAFPNGYGGVTIPYIHASPSKVGQNTVTVQPGPCVPPESTPGQATSTPTPTVTPTPTATTGPATCQVADITLSFQPTGQGITVHNPLDVMIVLDRSGSMNDAGSNPEQPLTDAKNAAKLLINQLDSSVDKVGLVSYASSASLNHQLTNNFNSVKNAIDNFNASGYTNIGDAVYKAQQELNSHGRGTAIPVIVLLSDGVANRRHGTSNGCATWPGSATACTNDAINQASTAKNAGTTIFTIGLNLPIIGQQHNSNVENLARSVLQSMATDSAHYYESPTSSDLAGIFQAIANQITNIVWKGVVLSEVLPSDLQYVNGSGNPAPSTINGQILTWSLGDLADNDTQTITLSASTNNPPASGAGTAEVSYTGADNQVHTEAVTSQYTTRACQ